MTQTDPERSRPAAATEGGRVSRRTLLIGAGGVAAVAAVGVGVGVSQRSATPSAAPPPGAAAAAAPAADALPEARALDAYHAGDAAFFGRFKLEGAIELERYATVEAMASAASVVTVGRVQDVVHTRTITGEGSDRVTMVGLVIEPQVVKGSVKSASRERLVVEFLGGDSSAAASVARLKAELPQGYAVWFLRSKAEEVAAYRAEMKRLGRKITAADAARLTQDARYYRLVSSQGLYLQGSKEVENPVVDTHDPGNKALLKRTDRIDRLSQLVNTVRKTR